VKRKQTEECLHGMLCELFGPHATNAETSIEFNRIIFNFNPSALSPPASHSQDMAEMTRIYLQPTKLKRVLALAIFVQSSPPFLDLQ